MTEAIETSVLLVDGIHGRYAGKQLAIWHGGDLTYPGYPATFEIDRAYLQLGPDMEHYDEVLDDVVQKAVSTKEGYEGWTLLEREGDIFLVSPDYSEGDD